jgi:D-arabinose 1-dehydrogenase-like Zn-dependent alcohol dehydrogenase
MHAMVVKKVGTALEWADLADRSPGPGQIRVKVVACGVCRTDLHVVDVAVGRSNSRVAEFVVRKGVATNTIRTSSTAEFLKII